MKLLKILNKYKPAVVIAIILAVVFGFVCYYQLHPEYVDQLLQVSPWVIVALLGVNFMFIAAIAVINHASASMCKVNLGKTESLLLTIYSSLANFFGPLQSGPGVRAAYLKSKYKVRLRDYTFVTLICYAIYAIISAFFLVAGVMPWWVTFITVVGAAAVSYGVLRFASRRSKNINQRFNLTTKVLATLVIATILQIGFIALRYGIELKAIGSSASIGQIISYSGAANFALFVSITPDGIGIREMFLLFSQKLHGIPTNEIVSASLLDRASYVLFLVILGIVAASLHLKKRLTGGKTSEINNILPD